MIFLLFKFTRFQLRKNGILLRKSWYGDEWAAAEGNKWVSVTFLDFHT